MRLRVKFIILVAGIVVVPFLVITFIFIFRTVFFTEKEPVPDYRNFVRWMQDELPEAIATGNAYITSKPPGLDFVVMAADGTVRMSTMATFRTGESIDITELLNATSERAKYNHFQIGTIPVSGLDPLILYQQMPKARAPQHYRRFFLGLSIPLYTTLVLLLFASTMSILIVRSMNRSIMNLENATRQIAEGNLDFALPIHGKDEIASLTKSFNHMRDALKDEYARRARFIMGVSHDLKTPLALIQGYVEAISDGYADNPELLHKHLEIIREKSKSLEDMVESLIDFAKMETGEWKLTHKEVNIHKFCETLGKRYTEDALILKRIFSYHVKVTEDIVIQMDEALVTRALENLISNAIRYTDAGGEVSMTVDAADSCIVLKINDTGVGISENELVNIFDPFFRGTNSRREPGYGLGLTIVKAIIDSHGWEIGVSSNTGRGTEFRITIPL